MAYGTIKVDTITFTDAGVDKSVTISGLVQNPTFSGNITVTGTVSGNTIQGQTVSGATITGGAAAFTTVTGGVATITSGVFALGSASNPSISFNGDANSGLYSPGADQVAISTAGSGKLFVNSAGNIGVGQAPKTWELLGSGRAIEFPTASIANFDNYGSGNYQLQLLLNAYRDGSGTYRYLKSSGVASQYTQNNGGDHLWYTAPSGTADGAITFSERMRITSAGLVGVGTSSPNRTLHVYGDQAFSNSNNTGTLLFAPAASANYIYSRAADNAITAVPLAIAMGSTDVVRIDTSGRVGVGTTSPSTTFHVSTSVDNSSNYYLDAGSTALIRNDNALGVTSLRLASSSNSTSALVWGGGGSETLIFANRQNERARFDSSGRLGIGTSSPNDILHLSNAGDLYLRVANTSTGINAYLGQDSNGTYIGNTGAAAVRFIQGASERMRLDTSGRLGIGTQTPGSFTADANRLVIGAGSADEGLTIYSGTSNYGLLNFADGTSGTALYRGTVGYHHTTDSLTFNTANTERFRCDSSGRLLVGTSSSAGNGSSIQAIGPNAVEVFRYSAPTGNSGPSISLTRSASNTVGTVAAVAATDDLGQVSFRGAGNGTTFVEGASIRATVESGTISGSSLPSRLVFSTTADGASSPTERMRIKSNGHILLGCPSAPNPGAATTESGFAINGTGNDGYMSAKLDNGPVGYFRRDGTDGDLFNFRKGSTSVGSISVTASATAYNTSSDYRLKENVAAVTDGITRLQQLKPSRFNFIADPDKTVDGFLAHEVQTIVPEAITGEKDAVDDEGNPQYQGIDQSKLVPLLTAALQEAIGEIESLKARLTAAGI